MIRTLPNTPDKRVRDYTGQTPPYLTQEAAQWLVERGIMHLVVDLPSIDRAHDEGRLTAHRIFFGLPPAVTQLAAATRATATVTELAYIPESVADGPYLLELQVPALGGDAVPSRPLLYRLTEGARMSARARGGTRARCRRPAGAASGRASRCRATPPARRSRTCAATPSACCRSPRASSSARSWMTGRGSASRATSTRAAPGSPTTRI